MAADTSLFRAGTYAVTYGGTDLGFTSDGVSIRLTQHAQVITIDAFGDAPVDGIYRGWTALFRFTLTDPTQAARRLIQLPFDNSSTNFGTVTNIGQTLKTLSLPLVLTPVAGINSNNKTLTVPFAAPSEEHGGWNLNTRLSVIECNIMGLIDLTVGSTYGKVFAET